MLLIALLVRAPLDVVPHMHLTSHLFHSFIVTTHFSLRPQACIFLSVCSRSLQATSWGSEDSDIVTRIFSSYTSGPGPRLTILTHLI